jgi:hypothetical protein
MSTKKQRMTDSRVLSRNIEILLPDESTIELDINIGISASSHGSIASNRLAADRLDRALATIQFMLITVLEKSPDEMMELVEKHAP